MTKITIKDIKEYKPKYEEIIEYMRKNIKHTKLYYSILQQHFKIRRLSIYRINTPSTLFDEPETKIIFKGEMMYLGYTDYIQSLFEEMIKLGKNLAKLEK